MSRTVKALIDLGVFALAASSVLAQAPAPPAPAAPPVLAEPTQQPSPPPAQRPAPMPMKVVVPIGMGKWWKDSRVVQELQLTPEQISQLQKSFLEHRLKLIQLRAALETVETQLEAILEADQPDQAKVSAQIDLVTQARGNLEKENAMMTLDVRRVLSFEQWKKLNWLQMPRPTGKMSPPGEIWESPIRKLPPRPPSEPPRRPPEL